MLNRLCYIVHFRHGGALKKIKKLPDVDIYYVSTKNKYVTLYTDKELEKKFKAELKKIKGIRFVEPSLLDQAEISIKVWSVNKKDLTVNNCLI